MGETSAEKRFTFPSDEDILLWLNADELQTTKEIWEKLQTESLQIPKSVIGIILVLSRGKEDLVIKACRAISKYAKRLSDVTREDVIREYSSTKWRYDGTTDDGRAQIHFYYHLHDPEANSLNCILKSMILIIFAIICNEATLRKGCVMVVWMQDSGWKNFNFEHEKEFMTLTSAFGPVGMALCQEVKLVNSPWYVWLAMTMMKPFMTAEMVTMVEFTDSNSNPKYAVGCDAENSKYFLDFAESNHPACTWLFGENENSSTSSSITPTADADNHQSTDSDKHQPIDSDTPTGNQ